MGRATCVTKEDFIAFLKVLAKDFTINLPEKEWDWTKEKEWENFTIDDYLNAISRCLEESLYFQAGDPFVKDQKFIDTLKPFVERYQECAAITYDDDGNEVPVKIDRSAWLNPESPWSIMANLFFIGRGYE